MSDTSRTDGASGDALLANAVRRLVPGAARIRAHRTPGGRYLATALDDRGRPIILPASDAIALGRWLGARFTADWDVPRVYDVGTGRLVDDSIPEER